LSFFSGAFDMGKIISIINQKGGVGKTTSAINLAASLAVAERQALLLDFDPQGNATSGLGISADQFQGRTVYQALVGQCPMADVVRESELPGLWVAPSDQNLSGAEVELVGAIAREQKLKKALEPIRDRFDFILIDCPPSLGLLTINALTASDSYLVPMQCEYFSLEGLSQLVSTAGLIQGALNPKLELEGILLTMFDSRNNLAHQVQDEVRRHFGDKLFESVIPRNVKLSEAPSHGKPVLLYDIESKGAKAYLEVTKEMIERNMQKTRPAAVTVSAPSVAPSIPASAPEAQAVAVEGVAAAVGAVPQAVEGATVGLASEVIENVSGIVEEAEQITATEVAPVEAAAAHSFENEVVVAAEVESGGGPEAASVLGSEEVHSAETLPNEAYALDVSTIGASLAQISSDDLRSLAEDEAPLPAVAAAEAAVTELSVADLGAIEHGHGENIPQSIN
jgi:chromosome partitioning protein